MAWRWERYAYFPPSRPRAVRGGIKAQSKGGAFGESWWAKRWISVLEGFEIGARLGRGRSYARRGQVLSIEIGKGTVKAKVQGSRPRPYDITMNVKTLSAGDWKRLATTLSHQAIFAAKLLAGEMPQDIEKVFKEVGLSLFPERFKDLETECSCPDWSNPCKHIAAVYYLLGEEFDRDPFLIFQLRGMSREELVRRLGTSGKVSDARSSLIEHQGSGQMEPLPSEVSHFWDGRSVPDDLFGEIRIPPVPAALPKRLGSFPLWRGEERFLEALESIYTQASPRGMDLFLGK